MASSSLEELLAKEGFKASSRRSVTRSRSSFHYGASSDPLHSLEERLCVSSERIKPQRPKSNNTAPSRYHQTISNKTVENKFKNDETDKKKSWNFTNSGKQIDYNSSEYMPLPRYEEGSDDNNSGVEDVYYSNQVSNVKRGKEKPVKDSNMLRHLNGSRKNIKPQEEENSYPRSNNNSNKNSHNGSMQLQAPSSLSLDEVAVQALVSILNGYIKRFLKDEDFRSALRHNCFSSLNFIQLEEENNHAETKVITSLEQAIEAIEQTAEESISSTYLKRTTMQLSIITGLSLNDLKYEYTCGIPNYKLSACAHLYLSVIYMIQKKIKVSAKHLLQVFCDSPFQARKVLLPDLWEHLFTPQLCHLKAWYNKEAEILVNTPNNARKLKLLQKVYNEQLDSGTRVFAVYYKDWLTEGVESPSIPSIGIPSLSSVTSRQEGSSLGHSSESASSTEVPFSPQPMVSKKLYDSVFSKPGVYEVEDDKDEDSLECCARGSYGSTIIKQTLIYESETVKFRDQSTGDAFHLPNQKSSTLEGSYFPSIPQEFICPLTGNIFEEPVTLESGETFEREAIKAWFEKGNRKCPVTGNTLECEAMPFTNLILKRLIDNWKSEQFDQLLDFASQTVENTKELKLKKKDEAAVFKLQGLFSSLKEEDKSVYAKHVISLGVLSLLFRRFELGNMEEKSHVLALLINFIQAESGCIYQIAKSVDRKCLVELLHSKEVSPTTNAILFLTELLSMKRRKDVTRFISGLMEGEDVFSTMHILLMYLKNSTPIEKPLIAVLLLHFDLLVEPQEFSICREMAVNAIAVALDASLNDDKAREQCCKALLILCGHFSSTGKITTKNSIILKQAGYNNDRSESEFKSPAGHDEEEDQQLDVTISSEDEEEVDEEFLMNLLESLIDDDADGESPFLKSISRCLDCRHLDLVRSCLITVTWLSSSLSLLFNAAGLNLSAAFLAIISQLKGILKNGELELKTLASMSLLNFSKISDNKFWNQRIQQELPTSHQEPLEILLPQLVWLASASIFSLILQIV